MLAKVWNDSRRDMTFERTGKSWVCTDFVRLMYSGLTLLATVFWPYRDGVIMCRERNAQFEREREKKTRPHMTWCCTQSQYTDTVPSSSDSLLFFLNAVNAECKTKNQIVQSLVWPVLTLSPSRYKAKISNKGVVVSQHHFFFFFFFFFFFQRNTRVLQKVLSLGSDYFSATFYQTYFYYKPSKYSPFTETHFCNRFTQSRKADK